MPVRLSIEIIKHAENDLRIIINDNGKRSRHSYDDCVEALSDLRGMIEQTTVHKESVYIEDVEGRRWPCSLREWFNMQPKIEVRGIWRHV